MHETNTKTTRFRMVFTWFLHGFYMVFRARNRLNCWPLPHLPIREKLVFANTADEPTISLRASVPQCLSQLCQTNPPPAAPLHVSCFHVSRLQSPPDETNPNPQSALFIRAHSRHSWLSLLQNDPPRCIASSLSAPCLRASVPSRGLPNEPTIRVHPRPSAVPIIPRYSPLRPTYSATGS